MKNLEAGSSYKFPGMKESTLQDEKLALAVAAKVYLHRLSVIWTSPLSDANRVKATNQFALPDLTYPMWTQHWPLAELREINKETRKLVSENGGKNSLSSTAVFYLKVQFFEILRDLDLNETIPPWFSRIDPKPMYVMYESTHAQVFWDVQVYAEQDRGKTYAHALTSALPVCTCGILNLNVPLAVCQLVVVNQRPQMKEKRTKITKKVCR